jgi:hypothetical protein
MVFEQHSFKSGANEEVKETISIDDEDITQTINQENPKHVAASCDYKEVLRTEVHEMLFVNYPPINVLLKENAIYVLQRLASNLDSNQKLISLSTGTKMKKIRSLISVIEPEEQVKDFDIALKDMTYQIINEIQKRKVVSLETNEITGYLKYFTIVQNLLKETRTYSEWSPVGYSKSSKIAEFDNLWKEVCQKEFPELPKFFNSMITYIETSSEIKTDSEKDKYLSSLLKIYAFLNMEQKTQFLVSFCHEISLSFKEFIANFLSISKEKTNLLTKKL